MNTNGVFKSTFRRLLAYSICFLLIFNIGFQLITDDKQTTQVLILATVLFSMVVAFVYACISAFFFKTLHLQNKFIFFLLLYLFSEAIVGLFTGGETFLFGIILLFNEPANVSQDIISYRKEQDLLFSSALMTSALIGIVWEVVFPYNFNKSNIQ